MGGKIKIIFRYCGFYPEQLIGNLRGLVFWNRDRRKIKKLMKDAGNTDFVFTIRPQLLDKLIAQEL